MVGKLIEYLGEVVFPSNIYCIACGSIIDKTRSYGLCDNCIDKIHWNTGKSCDFCGKVMEDSGSSKLCYDCANGSHVFDKGYTCARYGLYTRSVLMDFKYGGKSYIGNKLGEILYDRIKKENLQIDLIIPVPIHVTRAKGRGYNQAEIMAKKLGKIWRKPVHSKVISRKNQTIAMKNLSAHDRMENMRDAFQVNQNQCQKIKGKSVLLIDDIFTTGSTADSCSKVLKEAGATKVCIYTFAAGANLSPEEDI